MHIGLIIPSSNTVMEEEFQTYVTVHSTRLPLKNVEESSLKQMNRELGKAITLITDCSPDVIVYGCTSGSFVENVEKTLARCSVPVVTTSRAVIDALRALGVTVISVATPYTKEITQREKEFLETNGFIVKDIKGLGLLANTEIGKTVHAYKLAKSLEKADAVFISCTNFRTFEYITRLEQELSVPVVSSNSASLWSALRLAHEQPVQLGKLLEEYL